MTFRDVVEVLSDNIVAERREYRPSASTCCFIEGSWDTPRDKVLLQEGIFLDMPLHCDDPVCDLFDLPVESDEAIGVLLVHDTWTRDGAPGDETIRDRSLVPEATRVTWVTVVSRDGQAISRAYTDDAVETIDGSEGLSVSMLRRMVGAPSGCTVPPQFFTWVLAAVEDRYRWSPVVPLGSDGAVPVGETCDPEHPEYVALLRAACTGTPVSVSEFGAALRVGAEAFYRGDRSELPHPLRAPYWARGGEATMHEQLLNWADDPMLAAWAWITLPALERLTPTYWVEDAGGWDDDPF